MLSKMSPSSHVIRQKDSLGSFPADDPSLISKQQLFARIVGGLGGRAAEEIMPAFVEAIKPQ